MAAQIVQVVIVGNSVEIGRGLLNGQVIAVLIMIFSKCHCLDYLSFEL